MLLQCTSHCDNKLVRVVFDCGVVSITASYSVYIYIDAKLNRKRLEAVLVFVHILHLKPKYLPRSVRRGSECGNRIIDAYYHSNCWSIVYGFQDMTMGRTTDDGQTTQHRIIWPVRRPSSKRKALLPLHRKSHLTICTWMVWGFRSWDNMGAKARARGVSLYKQYKRLMWVKSVYTAYNYFAIFFLI